MRIFKNAWFSRFARKEGISDDELRDTVGLLEADQADADLGGDVYKVRIARSGGGKSGGYRVIVYFRSGERTVYAYGFAKSDRANISQSELRAFKSSAKDQLSLTDEQLEEWIKKRTLIEIK